MPIRKLTVNALALRWTAVVIAMAFVGLAGCDRHAIDARTPVKNETAVGDSDSALSLIGKRAPAFKLNGLAGSVVSSEDLAGKVYVLDFWATWCPPCRASLPHLAEMAEEEKAAGLVVYAVNVQEKSETAADFVAKTKLTVPVLLDADGQISEAYKANSIPETVIVGKDGVVAQVLVGFDPVETPAKLKAAVEAAMKK